jgi:hypothetical protein
MKELYGLFTRSSDFAPGQSIFLNIKTTIFSKRHARIALQTLLSTLVVQIGSTERIVTYIKAPRRCTRGDIAVLGLWLTSTTRRLDLRVEDFNGLLEVLGGDVEEGLVPPHVLSEAHPRLPI